jgi:Ca2+-transporting ATPase
MTTVHLLPDGFRAFSKGAPEVVLESCTHIHRNGATVPLDAALRSEVLNAAHRMAVNALRVLAFSSRTLASKDDTDTSIEKDMVFLGLAGMMDPPRSEVYEAIRTCREAGIRTVMITGDHKVTAEAVARELRILNRGEAMTGMELEQLPEDQLESVVESVDVYARISPAHKLRIVSALQKKGHVVAMTGDGVNDAPALKRADIGVAMGITGTNVSKEASDMILTDDNFTSIIAAVEEGRGIFENIRKYLVYLLSGNIGTVLAMVVALMAELPLPLTAVQILFINFIMDGLIAIALGLEPPEAGFMRKPPRRKDEEILHRSALGYILGVSALIATVTFGVFFWILEAGYSTTEAMTIFFVTLIFARLFNGLNCRSFDTSVFRLGAFTNISLVVGIILALFLTILVLYVEIFQDAFRTTVLSAQLWTIAFVASSVILLTVEMWKEIRRRKPEV